MQIYYKSTYLHIGEPDQEYFSILLNPPGRNLSAQIVPLGLTTSSRVVSSTPTSTGVPRLGLNQQAVKGEAAPARTRGDRVERGFGAGIITVPIR